MEQIPGDSRPADKVKFSNLVEVIEFKSPSDLSNPSSEEVPAMTMLERIQEAKAINL